jgi:RND family efflux transporter MFP subunit
MRSILVLLLLGGAAVTATGCRTETAAGAAPPSSPAGTPVAVRTASIDDVIEAAGRAEPLEQATLSTRLMGQVVEVAVREGDRVAQGTLLARIDDRDLVARRSQVEAQLAQAEAVRREARLTADRFRALHADSAAPRAQLDAAEAGLARADAAVSQAQSALAEVDAMRGYADIRAPFAGIVTQRFVDPGAFAAPGAPLVTVQHVSRLRVSGAAGPEHVRGLRRGTAVDVVIEGIAARGTIEGVVPAPSGQSYTVNVIVDNADGRFLAQSAATVLLPAGRRTAVLVPAAAVTRDGDLAGVRLPAGGVAALRWVRLGRTVGAEVEILAGLAAGDTVLVAAATPGAR